MRFKGLYLIFLVATGFLSLFLVTAGDDYEPDFSDQSASSDVKTYDQGYRYEENGWIYLHIEGQPYERGFQHGYLLAQEISDIKRSLQYLTYWNTGKEWQFFVNASERLFVPYMDWESLDEIHGIADGAQAAGVNVSWQEILAWNGYEELIDYWWPNEKSGKYADGEADDKDHCSAFIATGNATKDGRIVMAHNSWNDFEFGQFSNLILDIAPSKGHRIFMQSVPGYIDSFSDFFVTDAGLIGTETTIGGFSLYDPNEAPEFFRVRKAMQYSDNLDQFIEMMKKNNNGGYANTWLLGDVNTGEIMRFELGLQFYNVTRTKDGSFIGFNAPLDPRIRNLECSNTGYADIRRHQGARQVRLAELMDEHYGKIDVDVAKTILADHHDVYLNKTNPCSRTVDGHYELDAREYMSQPGRPLPFQPRGTVDGKVMDSNMARDMAFWAIWGNSAGMPFNATEFLEEHIQWSHLNGYLKDRPSQPWTLFEAIGDDDHKPITKDLIELIKENPEIGRMLEASIAKARETNPDPETNPVQNLSEYYDFIDRASELIPQDVIEDPSNLTSDQILQSICYFYFLVDQPLSELEDKGLYRNTIQYYEPFSSWLRDFAGAWGAFLDTEESWNNETYMEFYNDTSFGLQSGWYESPSNWKTFNQFFSRYLASPDARPIASPNDSEIVVSPADSVPQGTWAIDENSNIQVEDGNGLEVKQVRYYSVEDLLGNESRYKDAFANGVLTHTFLNVNDYHRYHFAVGGTIMDKRIISQNVALEAKWNSTERKYDPSDSTGWQFSQTRGYVIVDTGEYGLVALIPMGMAQVSSVNFEDDVEVGLAHEKGDMLGNFLFGGSDFVMLFQDKAGFEMTATQGKHMLMGEEYGIMSG